jgi:hypothetical protein
MRRATLLAPLLFVSGCFSPDIGDRELRCPEGLCPPGFQCAGDGRCHDSRKLDGTGTMTLVDAALPDISPDAALTCGPTFCTTSGADCGWLLNPCGKLIDCGHCPKESSCRTSDHRCVKAPDD